MEKQTQTPQLPQDVVKSRFFAQYFGLQVYHIGHSTIPFFFNENSFPITEKGHLKLKPLSILSDEDYRKIAKLYVKPIFRNKENYIDEVAQFKIFMIEEIDFLRSKGYAVPFMEYSVDDLISFGWVQLL